MDAKELKEQLDGLKADLETAVTEKARKEIAEQIKALEAKIPDVKSLEKGIDDIKEWQVKKDEADKKNQDALDQLIARKNDKTVNKEQKSFGEIMLAAVEEKTDEIAKMAAGEKSVKSISIELKAVGDITTSNVTGGSVWGSVYKPGIVEYPKRKVHMRQLLPGGPVGPGTDYYFMKDPNTGEGNFAFTAEDSTKPQVDEDLVESSVKIETLAGWARVSRKAMNNIPGFVSFLQSKLTERLLKVEDSNILYGDGTSPNLKGILASGNFTASTSSATKLVEKIIDDIAAMEDTYDETAEVIWMRPQHYYGFFKNTASGSGEYNLPSNVAIINGTLYISGIPCIPTTALAINTGDTPDTCDYVVANASAGASFLTQEGMRLEFFYEDSTNVRENKVTVRLEETVALPVFGARYFIKGTADVVI